MTNIFKKGTISKIFILTLIFLGAIGGRSLVKATSNEEINLIVGQSVTKTYTEIGIETLYGYIKDITISDKKVVSVEKVGRKTEYPGKSSDSDRINLKITANRAGSATVTILYSKKGVIPTNDTKVYSVKVSNPTITKIDVRPNYTYKNYIVQGEKISTNNLNIIEYYNDGSQKYVDFDSSKYSISPETGNTAGDITVTVTLKSNTNIKDTFQVHVNPKQKPTIDNDTDTTNKPDNTNNNSNVKTFKIKYVAIEQDVKGDMSKVITTVTYGQKTKLAENQFKREGYTFLGWKAYRDYDKKVRIYNSEGNAVWVNQGTAEFKNRRTDKGYDGYVIYSKNGVQSEVVTTAPSGTVTMTALWKKTTNVNTNDSTNTNTTNSNTYPEYKDKSKVSVGDTIKMSNGKSWTVFSNAKFEKVVQYIQASNNYTYKVETISGNAVELSKDGKEVGWIKWNNSSNGAINYFTCVEKAKTESNTNTSTEEMTTDVSILVDDIVKIILNIIAEILKACLENA